MGEIKERIRAAQVRAAVSVNSELIMLYWDIGRNIIERQTRGGWGARVIDRLAEDLRASFPEQRGFSTRNLNYMKGIAEAYTAEFVQQAAAMVPWGHHLVILDRVRDPADRAWYVRKTVENGWSRNVLLNHIASDLVRRQGKALTNFDRTLPLPDSELARELLKSSYSFDFLTLERAHREQDLERALVSHIRDFLLELGVGFALVGTQYPLRVGRRDFYVDLLFYHLTLRCFVAVELKVGEFEPEHVGKISFYVQALDAQVRRSDDRPSMGIVLCKHRDEVVVEYALGGAASPIGVSTYELLPSAVRGVLPSADALTAQVRAAVREQGGDEAPGEEPARPHRRTPALRRGG